MGSHSLSYRVLGAISLSHFCNDMLQSLVLASYPIFKSGLDLSFGQIGLITLTYQLTASILQPMVGLYTDKHPQPYSLTVGMCSTLLGLLLLSVAHTFPLLLCAAALVGAGSSIFHPESSRVARMASGGRLGLAQSIFQVGGNAGSATGPLLAAWIVMPQGQRSLAIFGLVALVAMVLLIGVGRWYSQQYRGRKNATPVVTSPVAPEVVRRTLWILLALVFSKHFYMASITSYLIFYLGHKFGISAQEGQYHLFFFLAAVAAGTLLGGPLGDMIGRRRVIGLSMWGIAPFALALPYAGLGMSAVLSVVIGFMLASAFPAIVVYAQELMPGRVGTVAGLFFGLAFGLGGIGAAVLGQLADYVGIEVVYQLCAFLPLLGMLAIFLPELRKPA